MPRADDRRTLSGIRVRQPHGLRWRDEPVRHDKRRYRHPTASTSRAPDAPPWIIT